MAGSNTGMLGGNSLGIEALAPETSPKSGITGWGFCDRFQITAPPTINVSEARMRIPMLAFEESLMGTALVYQRDQSCQRECGLRNTGVWDKIVGAGRYRLTV